MEGSHNKESFCSTIPLSQEPLRLEDSIVYTAIYILPSPSNKISHTSFNSTATRIQAPKSQDLLEYLSIPQWPRSSSLEFLQSKTASRPMAIRIASSVKRNAVPYHLRLGLWNWKCDFRVTTLWVLQ